MGVRNNRLGLSLNGEFEISEFKLAGSSFTPGEIMKTMTVKLKGVQCAKYFVPSGYKRDIWTRLTEILTLLPTVL